MNGKRNGKTIFYRKQLLLWIILLILAAPAAGCLYVPPAPDRDAPVTLQVGGSGQYSSIQEAINAAPPGATIWVAQGTYAENISVTDPKELTIEGGWDASFSSRATDSSLTVLMPAS